METTIDNINVAVDGQEPRLDATTVMEVDLLDDAQEGAGQDAEAQLELIRLDANITVIIPFTSRGTEVAVHYIDEPDYRGYVRCNGTGCVLCRAGKKCDKRILLPVYEPASGRVKLLPMSPNMRPGALRPQIAPSLKGENKVLFIAKPNQAQFTVKFVTLTPDMDDGGQVIEEFICRQGAGQVDLASVYDQQPNSVLAELPSVAVALKYQGIGDNDHN